MSDTHAAELEKATHATFLQEDIDRAIAQCGIDAANPRRDQYTEATADSMRAYARAGGDDNRLYCDRAYGEKTRWGGQIAPPLMFRIINNPLLGPAGPKRVPFRGIHQFVSGATIDFYKPLKAGDRVYSFTGVESVTPKASNFAGRSVIQIKRSTHMNQDAEVVAVFKQLMVMTERKAAMEKGALNDIQPAHYTPEDIARQDAVYAAEKPRGLEPRYWEDVAVGDPIGPMGKGPLTLTDIVFWHAGGTGFTYNPSTSRLAWENRQRIPAFYVPNDQGIPDIAMRVHWDKEWAKAVGVPLPYDYSVMREFWLCHALTDWMGDDAWLTHFHAEIRRFNYLGDLTVISGEVKAKRREAGRSLVDIRIAGVSQRGEETCHAVATIALPSREDGPVLLPQPPEDLARRALQFMEEHHRRAKA